MGFVVVVVMMILVDYNALRNNIRMINQVDDLELSNRIAYTIQRIKSNLRELFLEIREDEEPDEILRAKRVIEEGLPDIALSLSALRDATLIGVEIMQEPETGAKSEESELLLIDSLSNMFEKFEFATKEILTLLEISHYHEAELTFETDVEPLSREIQELIQVLVKDSEEEVVEAIAQMDVSVGNAIELGIYLTVLSVFLSLGIGLFLAKSISNPLNRLIKSTKQFGKGNFDTKVKIKTGDELELLGDSFNDMADELK